MTVSIAHDWSRVTGPEGLELLKRFLADDRSATTALSEIFDAAGSGFYDTDYAGNPDPEKIHVTTSCHLMVMALLNRLNNLSAADFYKRDPLQYVRMNCLIQRMLGFERLTLGWPVYGFGAELLGQTMIYPKDQAPGSDPGVPLLNAENWRDLPAYDPNHPLAQIIRKYLRNMGRLAAIEPVSHMPAPYSLAAEIFGQEPLIGALALDPDLVCELDLVVTRVLTPWCEDLIANVPDVWLEMSDASGSPMFVGPVNFLKFVVDPMRRMIDENPWGGRVFVANYRGDLPARAPTRGRRKKRPVANSSISFDSLLAAKILCCPHFLMRLEADTASLEKYVQAALENNMPLYLGIGAVRLDRNSVTDLAAAEFEMQNVAKERADIIRRISDGLQDHGQSRSSSSWPGDIYIEDTNAETSINLIQKVLAGVAEVN